MTVTFGYSAQHKLWVCIPAGAYTGMDIFNVTSGFHYVGDLYNAFKITLVDAIPNTVQSTVVAYRPYKKDETVTNATNAVNATNATNATTATALSSSAGSTSRPVYFSGGKPAQITLTLPAAAITTGFDTAFRTQIVGGTSITPFVGAVRTDTASVTYAP